MATRVSVARFCYVYIIGKTLKILSETARPRALIFGMMHHVVDLYQICSNNGPWAKSGMTCVKAMGGGLKNGNVVRETTLAIVVDSRTLPVVIFLDQWKK